jgi:hypothetical protein
MSAGAAELSCQVALAFAEAWFGRDDDGRRLVPLRAAWLFASGQLTAWDQWSHQQLDPVDVARIGAFLRYRPAVLANERMFARRTREVLAARSSAAYELHDDDHAAARHTGDPRRVADELLAKLATGHARRRQPLAAAPAGLYRATYWASRDPAGGQLVRARYRLPLVELKDETPLVVHAGPMPSVELRCADLLDVADRIDALEPPGSRFVRAQVAQLLGELREQDGRPVADSLVLQAGPTLQLQAPTGRGKTVLTRVVAVHLAERGLVTTLVVPDIPTTLELAHRLERDLAICAGRARVVPLMSVARLHEYALKAATKPPAWDPGGEWTRRQLLHGCPLAAASEDTGPSGWRPGREPCAGLSDEQGQRWACPFRLGCDRHRLFHAACSAQIVVTNHAAFQRGRLPIPVRLDAEEVAEGLSVQELLLRRSHTVLIDEVDAFQERAIDAGGRALTLWHRRPEDTPLSRLERQRRESVAQGAVAADFEGSFLTVTSRVNFLAERYLSAAVGDVLGPGYPTRLTPRSGRARLEQRLYLPRRWDNLLAARLTGLPDDASPPAQAADLLAALFPDHAGAPAADLPEPFGAVRDAIGRSISQDLGEDDILSARRQIDEALAAVITDEPTRTETVGLLLHRAFREGLRLHLQRLVNLLPSMRDAGMSGVDAVEDALSRQRGWQPNPLGPLGRMVFAFGLTVDSRDPRDAELTAEIVSGDPHGYVADLGLTTAVALTGAPRVVLGLSATGYLPGAAATHVHTPVRWYVPDPADARVRVRAATVNGPDGAPIRISGTPRPGRSDLMRQLGRYLWPQWLGPHLEGLRQNPETAARARVLLATNSYDQAEAVAAGLLDALAEAHGPEAAARVCIATRPGDATTGRWGPPAALYLPADDLAAFPATGADVLVAPYGRVNRGLNILVGGGQSAIGSIWACVRPVPLIDEPAELLAHVGARALAGATATADPLSELDRRQRLASDHLERLLRVHHSFSGLPRDIRQDVVAEMLVDLIQLIGRARRGGTPAELYLVDNAFHPGGTGSTSGLPRLFTALRDRWTADGAWPLLEQLHRSVLDGVTRYATTMTS